jgi:hypothetical protein
MKSSMNTAGEDGTVLFGATMRALSSTERELFVDSLLEVDRDVRDKLDGLARVAARICGTPVALVSLVGRDAQTFWGDRVSMGSSRLAPSPLPARDGG